MSNTTKAPPKKIDIHNIHFDSRTIPCSRNDFARAPFVNENRATIDKTALFKSSLMMK